jgi:predicted dehydrogenase
MADRIRALLIGCGGITRAWLGAQAVQDDVEIVAVVDIDEDAARSRAEEYELDALVETDYQAALEATDPEVVFNCTPPAVHCETTIAALEHGCDVLSEKPLAETVEEAERMVQVAQQSGQVFAVMQNRRWLPGIRRLKAFLDSGAIGEVTTLKSDFYIGAHFQGFRRSMRHVLLIDMAIHTFDQARMLTGADPLSVYCHEWNPPGSWYERDASAAAIFEMSDDVVYTYNGSWTSEGLRTPWEALWRIIGTTGTVLWNGGEEFVCERVAGGVVEKNVDMEGVELPEIEPLDGTSHAGCLRHFIDCLRTGRTPETICTDNIKSLAMSMKAAESAETGKKVQITV